MTDRRLRLASAVHRFLVRDDRLLLLRRRNTGDLSVVGVMHRRGEAGRVEDERVEFFLESAAWTGEIVNREPETCDDLLWADPRHLPANVVPSVRRAIAHGRCAAWFDSFGWDRSRRRGASAATLTATNPSQPAGRPTDPATRRRLPWSTLARWHPSSS